MPEQPVCPHCGSVYEDTPEDEPTFSECSSFGEGEKPSLYVVTDKELNVLHQCENGVPVA